MQQQSPQYTYAQQADPQQYQQWTQQQQQQQQQPQQQQQYQQPQYQQQYQQQQPDPLQQQQQYLQQQQYDQQVQYQQQQQQQQGFLPQGGDMTQHPIAYSAYPEHLINQSIPPGGSYQSVVQGLKGWNDIPEPIGVSISGNGEDAVANVEAGSTLKMLITTIESKMASLNVMQQRVLADSRSRVEPLIIALTNKDIESMPPGRVLPGLQEAMIATKNNDYPSAIQRIVTLMASFPNEARWALGVKRLIELYHVAVTLPSS